MQFIVKPIVEAIVMGELEILRIKSKKTSRSKSFMSGSVIVFVLSAIMCIYISFINYTLYHSIVEIFKVIIAFCITATALNTYNISKNNYFILIGIAFCYAGIFNLLHTLMFPGVGIIAGDNTNVSIQFSIIARYIEGVSLLLSCMYFNRTVRPKCIIYVYTSTSILLLVSVLYFKVFPNCFIQPNGQTAFKIASEYIIAFIKVCAVVVMLRKRKSFHYDVLKLIIAFILISAVSNILFSIYGSLNGFSHMLGHIQDALSYFLIYKAIIHTSLNEPYKLLFYELYSLNEELKVNNGKLATLVNKLKTENLERQKTENALVESEERYRKLVELLPDGIIVHNGVRIHFANVAAANLIGVESSQELVGRDVLRFINREFRKVALSIIEMVNEKQCVSPISEVMLDRVDGTGIYVELESAPIPYEGNMAQIIVVRDISERKNAEKNLELLNETMEYDRLKTEFFANISHELRTPLNVIYGALQLVDIYSGENEKVENNLHVRKYVKVMKQNSFRLLRLVNNLIDITKIDSGYFDLELKNYNIVSVIEEITLSVADYIEQRGITLQFDTEIEERVMCCDADKIERIMLNLLSNAIKFTPKGGSIEIYIKEVEDNVIISVKDTGIGIPQDKLEVIFERFRQVDKSLTRNREGSGIGLSLVKSLTEMHGGKICVASDYGKGSEFTIALPVKLLPEKIVEAQNSKEQSNIQTINIEFSDIYS